MADGKIRASRYGQNAMTECLTRMHFATRTEEFDAIQAYIDAFYNPVRRHSALGYLSPIDLENVRQHRSDAA